MDAQASKQKKQVSMLGISLILLFCISLVIAGLLSLYPSFKPVSANTRSLYVTTQTLVSGTITTNTTWTLAGSPYIVTGNLFVSAGIQLTIEPGVIVRVQASKAIQVEGILIARGTSSQPITFTSDNPSPSPGDWIFLKFTDSSTDATFDGSGNYLSGSILEYVTVEYAGGGTSGQGAIVIEGAAPFITHSIIRNNIVAIYTPFPPSTSVIHLTHNLITSNTGSLGVYLLGNSIFSNNTIINTSTGILVVPLSGQSALVSDNLVTTVMNNGIQAGGQGITNISNNKVIGNSGTGIHKLDLGTVNISKNFIESNGAGIRINGGVANISDNIIKNNISLSGPVPGGGISLFSDGDTSFILSVTVERNVIVGNRAPRGGGISVLSPEDNFTIANNIFIANIASEGGAAIYIQYPNNSTSIQGNTFTRHSGDATINTNSTPSIENNNFYNNSTVYEIYCHTSSNASPINATNNWWGTTSDSVIQNRIFDRNDDITVGSVNYLPILNSFNLSAPILPPTGLAVSPSGGGSLNLTWQANPEADVAGYKVYYDIDSGFPYSGIGATQGSSPIDVGNVNSFTLSGLSPGIYYFTVTAYDTDRDGIDDQTEGHESWFATEVAANNLSADLSITKSASMNPISAGSDLTYTIVVTNNGPDSAPSVVVTDNLPSGLAFLTCTSTNGGSCSGAGNNRTVTFTSLPASTSATITFTAKVDCSVTNGTIISNSASVSSMAGDPNSTNNLAIDNVTVANPVPGLSPVSQTFPSIGGTGSVNVTISAGCGWTATSNDSWISITSGGGGTGNGTVNYLVDANNSLSSRTGTLTIAGQTFTINQAGVVCAYSVIPTSRTHGPGAASDVVSVTTQSPCNWIATSQTSWITITSGASGTGNGTVFYSVAPNTGQARTGTMTIAGQTFTVMQAAKVTPFSFDGDAKSDISIWRPSTGVWFILNSSNASITSVGWGINGDKPVSGNFDNDGRIDIAIWRPSTGVWFIINSSNGSVRTQGWGVNGDVPAPGDYDGDSITDIAVWRPSSGVWYIINSHDNSITARLWGESTDKAVPGDYDGDGKTDIAIWRPSTGVWYIVNSSDNSVRTQGWGINGDKPVVGDYDGDGKSDVAIWRPSTAAWYIVNSANASVTTRLLGENTDIPVPGDYDGDGKTDIAVWRPSNGSWLIIGSAGGSVPVTTWGINGDIPVPSAAIP